MTQGAQRSLPNPDLSPLDGELRIFPTLGTFLWYLTTSVFCIDTEYPTKYCVIEIPSNFPYHIEYSSDYAGGSAGCSTSQNTANLSEMPQMSNSQILSNIIYPIEYSYGYTEIPAGYPTFSVAYLIYSTSH